MKLTNDDLANALEHSRSALLITNTKGVIVYTNEMFSTTTGYSKEYLLGKTPSVLQSPNTPRSVYNDLWKTIRDGKIWSGRILNRRKQTLPIRIAGGNNSENDYWAQLTITPLYNADGEVYLYAAVHDDLTTQTEIEELLDFERKGAQVRAHIASILQCTLPLHDRIIKSLDELTSLEELHIENKCGVFVANDEQTHLEMFALHGEFSQEFVDKEKRIPFGNCLCGRVAQSGEPIISDDCFCDDRHDNIFADTTAHGHYIIPLRIKEQNIGVMFLYTEPYPSRNQSRLDMLQDVGDLIAQAIRNDQTDQKLIFDSQEANDSSRTKSEFLANMSHEIRTPLNGILGFTDMLLRNDTRTTEEHRKEWLGVIQASGQHLLQLINDILDLSKVESGELELETAECNPLDILTNLASIMQIHANDKMLDLDIKTSGPLPLAIKTDPTRLRQILTNLIGNAIKFTEKGSVTMRVHLQDAGSEQRSLIFQITDTGMGIPDNKLHSIFDPFSQADNTITRNFGGTGLGLTISRNLAEALGGSLDVTSILGEGSTFTLSIPAGSIHDLELCDNSQSKDDCHTQSPESKAPIQHRLNGKILLVDDGQTNRQLIGLILTRAGAEVSTANNGQEACDLALSDDFDLILMDMQMPVMDGYTASAHLRTLKITTPIIALTASAMTGDRDRCLKAGCNDFLTKPVDIEELIDRAAHWTKQATNQSHEASSANNTPALISSLPMDDLELRKIVLSYIDTLSEQLATIQQAHANKEYAQLTAFTHKLIGSGGTVGFDPLSKIAAEIEDSVLAEEFEKVTQSINDLSELIAQIEQGAKELSALQSEPLE